MDVGLMRDLYEETDMREVRSVFWKRGTWFHQTQRDESMILGVDSS